MTREAKNISYKDFLTSDDGECANVVSHRSIIPEFQRNYVWKKSQISELIDAIDTNETGYYLGNIVIVKNGDGNGIGKIVDGQQRLITLSLILFILLDYVTDSEKKNVIRNQIWSDRENTNPRINFTKPTLDTVYTQILEGTTIDENELDKAQTVLYKSYQDIRTIINDVISNKESFLDRVFSLEFVIIRTYTENEAYLLFEGLNSTGLSLSAIELTKNAILGKIKELDPTQLNDALRTWNDVEQQFERINLGWFLKMLRHQWFSIDGYVTNPNLFKKIKEKKIQRVQLSEIQEYLNSIKEDSKKYLKLRETSLLSKSDFNIRMNNDAWNDIHRILFETTKLKLDQIYSVYLSLWKYGTEQHPDYINDGRKFVKDMSLLWNFIFLIKFSDISPSKYERVFATLSHDIQSKNYNEFKIRMKRFFNNELMVITSGISKDEFSKRISEEISTNNYDEGFVKFILKEYLGAGIDNETTLEHIIPKQDYSNWSNINTTLNLDYIEKIGNLTLLSEELNTAASNLNFDRKVIEAYSQSGFTKNTELNNEYGDGFKSTNPMENAVVSRGKNIGGILYDQYIKNLRDAT